ncbi:MAG TPA: TonB-dependent receptor [Candidatus Limnocylindrales bacterium]|nr:TonB-dependent receptor [Candidatus Limnocylindrales bacterium]
MALISAVLLLSLPAYPQGNTGRILGAVSDQSATYIAGATVTITDVQRGVSQTLRTDSDGAYVAINLLPGTYTLRAEVKGFKVFERKNILVEVGKDVRVDAVLQPGSATETITITEEVPMVDTTSTTLGGTISNEIINDLPLNGRNYQNLISLRPGTSVYPGGGPWTQTTNGIRPEDTSFIVDGITNDEAFMGLSVTNAAAVIGDAATILPIDAIQEFNTQVNPKAEFGWKPGAITSVGIKSGTNDIHGSAYAFGRSDSFDARNYFDHFNPDGSTSSKTPVELEQYGFSLGGKIIRDKLFYFGAFEAQRYTVGNALGGAVPTSANVAVPGAANGCSTLATGDCNNSVPDATADLAANNISVNPLSAYLLGFYTPNSSQGPGVTLDFPNVNSSKNALGKVDYHPNDHNTLGGSYFFGNDTVVGMDFNELLPQFRTNVHSRAQAVSAHWTYVPNSTWANDLRGGFTHYVLQILPDDLSFPYVINTGLTNPLLKGIPDIRITGFTQMGAFHNFPKIVGPDKVYDFIDQVSYLHGKHAIKFGGEIRRDLVHQATFRAGRGRIRFQGGLAIDGTSTPLEDFLAGDPSQATFLAGDPTRNLSQWLYAGYIQDDWRITPKLTLNLGLRYEFQAVPTEDHNLLGNWEPSVGLEQVGKNIGSIYNPDHKNFSPRIGFAWDVTGKGTTVVRAGASIVYSLLSMNTFLSQQNTQNTVTLGVGTVPTGATIFDAACPTGCPGIGNIVTTGITLPSSSLTWVDQTTAIYPSNVTSQVECGNPDPCDTFAMNRHFRTPYVSNWTLGIQHAFSGKLSFESTYVGNHGTRLAGVVDANQPDLATGVQPFAAQFPYLGFINTLSNFYGSTYNGWQNTLTARNYHGLDFVLGYTYSHALDDMSSNWVAYLPQDSTHPLQDHASGDEDIRHRFTLSVTYSLPEKKGYWQMLEGWQLNTIITVQSGQPWNVNDQSNNFSGSGENADRWDFFGSPSDFKSGGSNTQVFCSTSNPGDPSDPTAASCGYFTQGGLFPVALSSQQSQAAWTQCFNKAPDAANLAAAGCYVSRNGRSVLVPNATGAFGTMGRNIFRDTGFRNVDLSVSKNFRLTERFKAQFRVEMFNLFNHPNFANPNGATSGYGQGAFSDPSQTGQFGCGCATPDSASFNPVLGSGSARAIQLGLKFTF